MRADHTPLPWKLLPGSTQVVRDQGDVIGETICEAENSNAFVQNEARNEANAAFIVRACNVHDELLAACKAQHDAIDSLFAQLIELTRDHTPDRPFFPTKSGSAWDAAIAGNAAIAKAEGRS